MARAKKDSIEAYNAPFPVRLRELVKQNKCTQADLAQATGRTRQTVSQYTIGSSEPSYETLTAIARYFGVTTDYLLGLTDDPAPRPSAVDSLGLKPDVVELLTDPVLSNALWKALANDVILGTMLRGDAFMNYVSMIEALKLPKVNLLHDDNGEDPIYSMILHSEETRLRGYVLLSGEEAFHYHAEKVGQALTRWLIDAYQDQGAWNRKEEQQHGID